MEVRARFYRRYDADPSAVVPAESILGWDERMLDIPFDQSMLVCMHFWNLGLDERLPYGRDVPYAGWYRISEYIKRTITITREVMPSLLAVARKSGLTVAHVGIGPFATKYPGYAHVVELAGPEPTPCEGAPESSIRDAWQQGRTAETCGEHNVAALSEASPLVDFPHEVMPQDDEPVVITTHQLNEVCRHRGIWHLIYCGFLINACIMNSPGGMVDMRRLGYFCTTVRDATTAGETRETARHEWGKELALSSVDYVFESTDLIAALCQTAP